MGLCKPVWAGKLIYWSFNKPLSRIELITDAGVQPQAQFLANPARVVIDLPDTTVDKRKQRKTKRVTKYVKEVRAGQFDSDTTRLVVELNPKYTVRADDIKIRNLSPNRWFVQLPNFLPRNTVPNETTTPIAIDVPGIKLPPPQPNSSAASPPEAPPSPSSPPPTASPIKTSGIVVAIDPGHGGADVGAVGIRGLQEKVAVLSISTQVAEKLRQKGIKAVLTRSGDQEIDLAPRVATAEGVKADLFVSIHANSISMSRPDINGLETYYYASSAGYRLARAIHNRILSSTNMRDRGVRQARFYVIRRTSMPAVLVETGFVTGSEDAARLASAAQRTQLAEAIAQGILDYIQRR